MIWVRHCVALLAVVSAAQGGQERAEALLATVADTANAPPTLGTRLLLVARAELALAGGAPDQALALTERLARETVNGDAKHPAPHLRHLRGRALAAAGRLSAAATELEAARDAARAHARPDLLWRAHADLAQIYAALGRPGDAGRVAGAAQEIVEELARALVAEGDIEAMRLAEQFAQRAMTPLPTPQPGPKGGRVQTRGSYDRT